MNNNEFHDQLSRSLGYTVGQTQMLTDAVCVLVTRELQEGHPIFVPSFGTFIVSKTLERIVQNSETGERSLVPPRLEAHFIPNAAVEEGATSLHSLSLLLAAERQMETTDAEEFVRAFFLLIRLQLNEDSYVNVNRLGTFRKIEDNVTFSPCTAISDAVNKPFADFETVTLGEKVALEEAPEQQPVIKLVEDNSDEDALMPGTVIFDKDNDASDESKTEGKPEDAAAKPKSKSKYSDDELTPTARRALSLPWNMIASILFAGILIGGFSVWLMMRPPSPVTADETATEVNMPADPKPAKEDKKSAETKKAAESKKSAESKKAAEEKKASAETKKSSSASDTGKTIYSDHKSYRITGTKTTHTVVSGESLASISRKYYGNSNMWRYIVEHNENVIKNPDSLREGMTLEIPELEEN